MADIDQIIAGGAGASSRADFSKLGSLWDSFYKAQDQAYQQEGRNLFKGGVPLTPDGQLDTRAMSNTLFQHGDVAGGVSLATAAAGAADRSALAGVDAPPSQSNIVSPPSSNRNAYTTVAPALGKGGQATPQQGGTTIMQVLSAQGIPNDQLGAAGASIARQLGVDDPNAPINLQDTQVRNVLIPAVARLKQMGIGQVVPQGQPQGAPQAPPQVMAQGGAPQPAPVPAPQPAPMQASPAQVDAQNDPILKRLTFLAASPDKQTAAAAETRLKSYLAAKEPTTEMKNATASGMSLPAYQEKQGDLAAQQAGAVESAKGYVAKYQSIDDAGTKAIQEIPKLQTALKLMDNPDFYSGIGNNYKLALNRVAVAVGGDPDKAAPQEIVGKVIADSVLNGLGALKGLGPVRVAEMNLASRAAMSPDNTPQTNRFLANVALRIQQRAVDVSDMAQNYNDGVLDVGFDKKVREMDKKSPLLSSDEVQRFQRIIDGKEKQTGQPSGQQRFASPADVHAAVAGGKLKSGDSFVDPTGKTRYVP